MNIIKDRRNELGVTQRQLALKCRVHQTHISKLELGERKPSLKVIFMLSDYLHLCPVSILIELTNCCLDCQLSCPIDLKVKTK